MSIARQSAIGWGMGASFSVATPAFASGHCREARWPSSGSGWRSMGRRAFDRHSNVSTWRGPSVPPASVLPSTGAPAIPCSVTAPCGATSTGSTSARFEGRTWGLITQWHTVSRPARHRRFPSIPGAHRVPVEAHEKNKRGSEGGDKDFSRLNDFKGLAEKSRKSVHGVPGRAHTMAWPMGPR